MKTITLEIENEEEVKKIMWMLSHFKSDGVIIKEDNIQESIRESAYQMSEVKSGNIKARSVEEILNEI